MNTKQPYNLIGSANVKFSPLTEDSAWTATQLFGLAETPFQYQYFLNNLIHGTWDPVLTFSEICGKGSAHPMSFIQANELPYFGNTDLPLPQMKFVSTPKWVDPNTAEVHIEEPVYDTFEGKTYIIPEVLTAKYNIRGGTLTERYSRARDGNAYRLVQCLYELQDGKAHRRSDLPAVVSFSPKTREVTRETYYETGEIHRYAGPAQVHKVTNCSDVIINYYRYGKGHNAFGPNMLYLLPTSNMHYKINLASYLMDNEGALRPTLGDNYKLVVFDFIHFLQENDISFVDFVCRMHERPDLQFDFHMRFGFDPMIDVVQANFYNILRQMEGRAYVPK